MPILRSWSPAGFEFIKIMISINLGLAAFNLLPIPPLDGSKALYSFLPPSRPVLEFYFWMERYGYFVLLFLLLTGLIRRILNPFMFFLFRVLIAF
jgi:Zn-dependent protease